MATSKITHRRKIGTNRPELRPSTNEMGEALASVPFVAQLPLSSQMRSRAVLLLDLSGYSVVQTIIDSTEVRKIYIPIDPTPGVLPVTIKSYHCLVEIYRSTKYVFRNQEFWLSLAPSSPFICRTSAFAMWTVTSRQTQRLTTLAVGSGLFVFAVHLAFYFGQSHDHNTGPLWGLKRQSPSSLPVSPACRGYPSGDSDVVIVVKTGATEALARIPTLLTTFLSCVKENEVVFFSDMEQKIAGAHLHDALVDVVDEAKTVNADFELYELQKQLREYGGDVSSLPKAKEAWALDKYKNIHTAQKAWELHPNRTWYFFIDADTYVVWPSFFAWIKRLDPAKHLYLGRTIHTLNLFAHGGPGYLLSREAMRSLVGEDARKIASDFDISASTTCCGDAELAGSLSKKGVSLIDAYPLINHQKPREIQFGPKYWCPKYWCQPIITMHHVSPEEINNLWQFQQSRSNPEVSFKLYPSSSA